MSRIILFFFGYGKWNCKIKEVVCNLIYNVDFLFAPALKKKVWMRRTKKEAFFELYTSSTTLPFIFSSFHYEMQALDLRATLKTGVRFSVFI